MTTTTTRHHHYKPSNGAAYGLTIEEDEAIMRMLEEGLRHDRMEAVRQSPEYQARRKELRAEIQDHLADYFGANSRAWLWAAVAVVLGVSALAGFLLPMPH